MEAMVDDMSEPWQNFQVLLTEERSAEIVTSIEKVMDWAVEYLGKLSRETDLEVMSF